MTRTINPTYSVGGDAIAGVQTSANLGLSNPNISHSVLNSTNGKAIDFNGSGGGYAGLAQSALSTAANIINQNNSILDGNKLAKQYDSMVLPANTGYGSLAAAKGAWRNYKPIDYVSISDMGYNQGAAEGNLLTNTLNGAVSGLSAGPLGAVLGGVGSFVASLFGNEYAKRKASKQKDIVNKHIFDVNNYNQNLLTSNLENTRYDMLSNSIYNSIAAYGGPLQMKKGLLTPFGNRFAIGGPLHSNGADWTNGIITVNAGRSHEENPYDGVQMGIDPEGTPNLVEEGEVIFKDYVFSNRLRVPKATRNKYRLRATKNLTFADAAKDLQKESEERPNDPISMRGLEDWMAKLAEEQEGVREKEYMKEIKKQAAAMGITPEEYLAMQMQQQQMQQQMPMDANGLAPMVAAYGGNIHIKPSKRGTFTAAGSKHGMGVQEFASKVLANKDDYSPAMVKKANFAKNAAGWKHGLGGNLYDGLSNWTQFLHPYDYLNGMTPEEAINLKQGPIIVKPVTETKPTEGETESPNLYGQHTVWLPGYGDISAPSFRNKMEAQKQYMLATNPPVDPNTYKGQKTNSSWLDKLRYVPALGSALGVFSDLMGWTNKPDYRNADAILEAASGIPSVAYRPIGDYMEYKPLDRMFWFNKLAQSAAATRRQLANLSGGNRGTAMAGILAADANALDAMGNAAIQGEKFNMDNKKASLEFNRTTNMANAENDLKAQMANQQRAQMWLNAHITAAQMRDAVDARAAAGKSANLTNLFDNIGNIGWEEFNRNMVNTSNPYYHLDRHGNVVWSALGLSLTPKQQDAALYNYGYYRGKNGITNSPLDYIYARNRYGR